MDNKAIDVLPATAANSASVFHVNDDQVEQWPLCCSTLHKSEIVFFVQVIFLFTIMIFSMVQIINKSQSPEIYFSLLSSCIGIIIPSPSLSAKK
jgi:hypothetical protein